MLKYLLQIKNGGLYSFDGLKAAFRDELAFQLEVYIALIALPLAYFIGKNAVERALLISSIFIVLIAELLNTAIEAALDRLDNTWHPLTKKAKDCGSAAVLLSDINFFILWITIIISH